MTDSLLSRLQALTEPSREIDAEIALANGWRQLSHDLWIDDGGQCHTEPLHYTASIDAALTLVPKGAIWAVGGHVSAYWADVSVHSGSGPTSVIALLGAIMKATEETRP
jgi:hypothetical protein